MKRFNDYVRQTPEFYPPHVAEVLDISETQVYAYIARSWETWKNPHVVDNMVHTSYKTDTWVYEICNTPYRRGRYLSVNHIKKFWEVNRKENQHYSMFAHDSRWAENADESDSVSCSNTMIAAPMFWLELDRKDYFKNADLSKALEDGQHIVDRIKILTGLDNVAWLFTSGNNSAHVLVNGSIFGNIITQQNRADAFYRLALELAGDIRFDNGIINPYELDDEELTEAVNNAYGLQLKEVDSQKACASLENIDPNIYRTNSLIRQPYSIHESSGQPKALIGNENVRLVQHPPVLMNMWFQNWERPEKPKKIFDCEYDNSYIMEEYSKVFPEIGLYKPNHKGWVGKFYNPFYEDTNAGVSININTGYMKDFGSQRYSMTFEEFLWRKANE